MLLSILPIILTIMLRNSFWGVNSEQGKYSAKVILMILSKFNLHVAFLSKQKKEKVPSQFLSGRKQTAANVNI